MIGVTAVKYVFMTDASCDLTQEQVIKAGVEVLPMEFQIEDHCYQHFPDCRMMSLEEFYTALKNGAMPKTTQINYMHFKTVFETYLKAGKDILYTGISTGLSGTLDTCMIAVRELEQEYPQRTIKVIDSRCDSAGLGLLVYLAGLEYQKGASLEALEQFILDTRDRVAHWFVVDDLDQLKRGGRISSLTATFGKALQIKPLITCDATGKLVNAGKIRGKSNVIPTLERYARRDAVNAKKSIAFVAHADNPEGAKELRKAIKGMFKEVQICPIGPVIGSHVGAGMLAVVFTGKRNPVA